jgi:hypothetical protein
VVIAKAMPIGKRLEVELSILEGCQRVSTFFEGNMSSTYLANQAKHHRQNTFREELIELLKKAEI